MDFRDTKTGSILGICLVTVIIFIALEMYNFLLIVMGLPGILISIFLFPFAEELYKYIVSKKYFQKAFLIIVIFSIFEFIMIKLPLYDFSDESDNIFSMLLPFAAINFHISTAFVYKSDAFLSKPVLTFSFMLFLHSFYNFISFLNVSSAAMLAYVAIASLTPYIWLILSNKFSNPAAVGVPQKPGKS